MERRNFFRNSSLVTAGFALSPLLVTGSEDSTLKEQVEANEENKVHINIVDYGCKPSHNDNKTPFIKALNVAKTEGKKLFIPKGEFNIVHNDVESVDMNGCTGIIGDGTLIFDVVPSDNPTMHWKGKIEIIGSAVPITENECEAIIDTGLVLNSGDTIFIVSNENIGNTNRDYTKGQRMTVNTYDSITGLVTFYESFYQSINAAYFYLNSVQPKIEINGVNIFSKENTYRKGVQLTFCDVSVSHLYIKSFSKFCLNISSSNFTSLNYRATDFYHVDSSTSYGLQISGLTRSECYNLDLKGGRHALTHGDDGTWQKSHAGISGLASKEPIFLSSESTTFGGVYSSHPDSKQYAVDTHAGCHYFIMHGGKVNVGFALSNSYAEINNVTINKINYYGISLGNRSDDKTKPRGKYIFNNVTQINRKVLELRGSITLLEFNNFKLQGEYPVSTVELINYHSNYYKIDSLIVNGFDVSVNKKNKLVLNLRVNEKSVLNNISTKNCQISIITNAFNSGTLSVSNVKSINSTGYGILQSKVSGTNHLSINMNGVECIGAKYDNLYLTRFKNLNLSNVIVKDSFSQGVRLICYDSSVKISNLTAKGNGDEGLLISRIAGDMSPELNIVDADLRGNTGNNYDVDSGIIELQKNAVLE